MAHEGLKHLQRHTTTEAGGSEGVPELVRVNVHAGAGRDLADDILNSSGAESAMRPAFGDKKRVFGVCAGLQVFSEGKL